MVLCLVHMTVGKMVALTAILTAEKLVVLAVVALVDDSVY